MITASKALQVSNNNTQKLLRQHHITAIKEAKNKLRFYKRKIRKEVNHDIKFGLTKTKVTVDMGYFRILYGDKAMCKLIEWLQPWIDRGYRIDIPNSIHFYHYQPVIISWEGDT